MLMKNLEYKESAVTDDKTNLLSNSTSSAILEVAIFLTEVLRSFT